MTKDEMKVLTACFDEMGFQIVLWKNEDLLNKLWVSLYKLNRYNYPDSDSLVSYTLDGETISSTRRKIDNKVIEVINNLREKMDDCDNSFDGYMLI